jgi:hypothetical protein
LCVEHGRGFLVAFRVAARDVAGGEQDGIVDRRDLGGCERERGAADKQNQRRSGKGSKGLESATPGQDGPPSFCPRRRAKPTLRRFADDGVDGRGAVSAKPAENKEPAKAGSSRGGGGGSCLISAPGANP